MFLPDCKLHVYKHVSYFSIIYTDSFIFQAQFTSHVFSLLWMRNPLEVTHTFTYLDLEQGPHLSMVGKSSTHNQVRRNNNRLVFPSRIQNMHNSHVFTWNVLYTIDFDKSLWPVKRTNCTSFTILQLHIFSSTVAHMKFTITQIRYSYTLGKALIYMFDVRIILVKDEKWEA